MPGETIGAIRKTIAGTLAVAGVPDFHFEADQILSHISGLSRATLHAHPERPLARTDAESARSLASRRSAGEPLAYVLGDAIFCGRTFRVDRRVLIPRPETETLTATALATLPHSLSPRFADWCTGSGCIALTLLAERTDACGYGTDRSPDALDLAGENALRLGVADRLTLLLSESPTDAAVIPPGSLDLVVTNPPYVTTAEMATLEPQVRDWEPAVALEGGADGLRICRMLLHKLPRLMKPGAPLLMETGGKVQAELLSQLDWENLQFSDFFFDHRGIARFLLWRKRG